MEAWFRDNIIKHKIVIETSRANSIKWGRDNGIFADVLLRADDGLCDGDPTTAEGATRLPHEAHGVLSDIQRTTIFPAHRAMLIRSEFFLAMFSSGFREAQMMDHLQIIPVACSPEVLEIVLTYLYTDKADFPESGLLGTIELPLE